MRTLCSSAIALLLLLPAAAAAHPKMLFVGDSITAGVGAEDPAKQGFVSLFAERFPELQIANVGCSGSTTRDWTIDGVSFDCVFGGAWPELAVPELPAQITHIMLGINDAYGFFESSPDGPHGNWLTPEEYGERLRLLVKRSPGLVFVSVSPPLADTITGLVVERLRVYRDVVLSLVDDSRRVELGVDFHELLDPHTDMHGCHPNTRGHAIMADALEESVLSRLPMRALARYKHSERFKRGGRHGKYSRHVRRGKHDEHRSRASHLRQRAGKHISGVQGRGSEAALPLLAIEAVGSPCEVFPRGD